MGQQGGCCQIDLYMLIAPGKKKLEHFCLRDLEQMKSDHGPAIHFDEDWNLAPWPNAKALKPSKSLGGFFLVYKQESNSMRSSWTCFEFTVYAAPLCKNNVSSTSAYPPLNKLELAITAWLPRKSCAAAMPHPSE